MGPKTAPSGYSAKASAGSGRDRQPPEEAVIRIHFFLLCALVHCLSSSVQCNQVNERACNEAIRCSPVVRARHSILSWRTLARGACAAVSGHRGINSGPRLPQAAPLSHALRTGSAVSRGLGSFYRSFIILPRVHRCHETSRSGFGGIPRRGYQLQWPDGALFLHPPLPRLTFSLHCLHRRPFLLWLCLLHLCNMWKLLGGRSGAECMC